MIRLYITRNTVIYPKNLTNPHKLTDGMLLNQYIRQLRKDNAVYKMNTANNTVVVKQYLCCYMSVPGTVNVEFSNNPTHALDMPDAVAQQLLCHKDVVGGTLGWRLTPKLVPINETAL